MSRFWRLLETGLRFCAHTGGVQDKNAVVVLDRVVLDGSCSVLGFLGFRRRLWQYLTSFVKYRIVLDI